MIQRRTISPVNVRSLDHRDKSNKLKAAIAIHILDINAFKNNFVVKTTDPRV